MHRLPDALNQAEYRQMNVDESGFSEEEATEMETLMATFATLAVRGVEAEEFCNHAPLLIRHVAPSMVPPAIPRDEQERGLHLMARQFWNQMPLPQNGFRPAPLPEPERNGPCICGSGQKYKHCCMEVERAMHKHWQSMPLLSYVLSALPKKALAEVPVLRLPTEQVQITVDGWMHESPDCVVKLLEPVFNDLSHLQDKHAWMYGALCAAYDALGKPRKKQQLQKRVLTAPSRQLRSDALQHQATQLSDQGDFSGAWQAFQLAMRATPDDPHLSHLEVLLLQSEGKPELARERALHWIQRLKRDKQYDHSHLIEALEALSTDPAALHYDIATQHIPELMAWAKLMTERPQPERHYTLEGDDAMAQLKPDAALRKIEAKWASIFPQQKPSLTYMEVMDHAGLEQLDKWPQWLAKHPLAWQSFTILDDIYLLLKALPVPTQAIQRTLLEPVLQHALALWQSLLANKPTSQTVPWGFLDNRPALRLLAQKALMHFHAKQEQEHISTLELMLALNPNDNHGFRDELSDQYLHHAQLDKALALHARYENDGAHLSFNQTLTLYAQGDKATAAKLAKQAKQKFPEVFKMLLAKQPKPPKLTPGIIQLGGKDEAWYYRSAMYSVWQNYGAIEWLRTL